MSVVVNLLNQENIMQLFKILCSQCPHRESCSKKTRMFVNYCGSRLQTVEKNVRAAITECRSRHGYMLQSVVFPDASSPQKAVKVLAAPGS